MSGNRHRGRKALLVVGFLLGMNMTRQEIRNIHFHIRGDDYFGTLATRVDLARQDIGRRGYKREHDETLETWRDELVHLQENYTIVRKHRGGVVARMRR